MPINVRVYASLVVFLILLAAPSAVAAKYAGGSGTMLDPYQIAAADDLVALGETPDDYDKHFVLISDIDLDPNRPGGRMFDRAVIAPNATDALSYSHGQAFAGQLDGRGHIIRNLCIEAPDSNGVGLVGCVAEGGLIRAIDRTCSIPNPRPNPNRTTAVTFQKSASRS